MYLRSTDIGKKIDVLLYTDDGFSLAKFKPRLTELFYQNEFPFRKTWRQVVRYSAEYLQSHYSVYYLVNSDKNVVGFCVVQKCGAGRYAFLGKDAYMIGPYVIKEDFRRKGLSVKMLKLVLEQLPDDIEAYDWIQKSNIASLKASKGVGGGNLWYDINSIYAKVSIGKC